MTALRLALENTLAPFALSSAALLQVARDFHQEMLAGLMEKESSLKMLPSFLGLPNGQEQGSFLALDFGGTNLRILKAELSGQGRFRISDRCSKPLTDPAGHYDYLSRQADGRELFDFIAALIGALVEPGVPYTLGHTFSFPIRQTALNEGVLLHWTKEIETGGVVGREINQLLHAALLRQGLDNVRPVALLNDTVGTLLAAAYGNPATDIGSICGTGHNTAYVEPSPRQADQPMIINMESGNFDKLPFTVFDERLNAASEQPRIGRLEKMLSGRYLGELARRVAVELLEAGLLSESSDALRLKTPGLLGTEHLSFFLADQSADAAEIRAVLDGLHLRRSTLADRQAFRALAAAIVERSARLAAATYAGILLHIDPNLTRCHHIAVDGSLYEKTPGYATLIDQALSELFAAAPQKITTALSKDGSGIGAAIAAAIASRSLGL